MKTFLILTLLCWLTIAVTAQTPSGLAPDHANTEGSVPLTETQADSAPAAMPESGAAEPADPPADTPADTPAATQAPSDSQPASERPANEEAAAAQPATAAKDDKAAAAADQPEKLTADQTKGMLLNSADENLASSVEALNHLREQISAERLPLSNAMTAEEEKLAKLRSEYDEMTRKVDTGNLDVIQIKAEIKARQDELDYIGNLLNEYSMSYETRVNISELQHAGETLKAAKRAAEDTNLTLQEKFNTQIAFVDFSMQRMMDVIGGMDFPGIAVGPDGSVVNGTYMVIGPSVFFRAGTGNSGGVVQAQTGSDKPMFKPLPGELETALLNMVEKRDGILVLDPTRGAALKAATKKTDVIYLFKKGGPIMWPLLFAALLSFITVSERIFFMVRESLRRDPRALENFFAAASRGNLDEAIRIGKTSKFYLVRTLGYALEHRERSLANALVYAQEQEMKRFRRGIPVLDTIITLAPLLGLLGTVTGMMASFAVIGGELSSPGAITGGIAEALIATAVGLGIAITGLIPFNYLNTKLEEARIEIETAANQLELIVHPGAVVARQLDADETAPSLALANT